MNSLFGNTDFYVSCTKITEFMKHLKTKGDSDSISEKCNYLNYKVNEELRRLKKVSDENSEFYDELLSVYKEVGYDLNIICKKKNIGYLNNDVFNKINDIRDIYINFNKFKSYARTSSGTNCEDINKCIELYTKHKVTCDNVNNKNFCVALDNFKKDYQVYVGQIIRTCESAEESLESYINTMHGLQGKGEGTGDDLYGEPAEEIEEQATDPVDIQNNSQMGQSKSNITVASSTILVLSSASFIIYKFTPLGTWLRPLVQRKNKNTISMYDEALRFNNNSSIQINDSGNTEFNLQYHSS